MMTGRGVCITTALVALLLTAPVVSLAAAVHTFDCKKCHIPGLSVTQLGGGNVCLSCHDEPVSMLLNDGTTGTVSAAFTGIDASNALGNNPGVLAGKGETSHNWGAPDTQLRAGATAPDRTLYPQFYSRYGSSTGKVTCTRCHNPHADRGNPQLLVLGAGSAQQMCLACHAPWNKGSSTDRSGSNVTHPVGIDYAAAATGNPGGYAAPPPEDDGNLQTAGSVSLFGGKVMCGSCHQTHFADSNAATADTPANFAGLSDGGGDGKLLRGDGPGRADTSSLCRACHTYHAHGKADGETVGCMVCHSGHAYDPVAPNYFMLRKSATTTTYNTVNGLEYSNADVLDPGNNYQYWNDRADGTANGYCERCHGDARDIGLGAGSYHVAAAICTDCHGHNSASGAFGANCGACHGNGSTETAWPDGIPGNNDYPAYAWADDEPGSHAGHTAALGGNASCGSCHPMPGSGTGHLNGSVQVAGGGSFSFTLATGNCSNISCHAGTDAVWGATACLGCHNVSQGSRAAVGGQFSDNSHHVQGVTVTDAHCYQCHWEANSNGTINSAYHGGTANPGAAVDLVVYGAGARPAGYAAGTSAIQYTANGSRTEITKLNQHCLGCHSDANNASTPFGDGNTPKQYAWDGTSVASRYSQTQITPWGKYADTTSNNISPKNTQAKAYSAHGNAVANQGGWNLTESWPNTRNGSVNVACYDCHNSHGSSVSGKTTSYNSATVNGGLLKETTAGKGGYAATYKPAAGGTEADKNQRNPGADLCFDCHMNASSSASLPWGYQSTFGASQMIMGYFDTPYLTPGTSGTKQRYTYRQSLASKGGHFGASSPLETPAMASIDGLCTPCHDPHGVSPTLGSNQAYGVPLLKGTWLTSPYLEDVAPQYNYAGEYINTSAHIDQNTFGSYYLNLVTGLPNETDAKFAGLCLNCHPKGSLTDGVTHTWKSKDRIHESVKGWKTTNGNVKHSYSCSKCHTPHIGSALPRLMVTNCLDYTHKGRSPGRPDAIIEGYDDWGTLAGRIPGWRWDRAVSCHDGPSANNGNNDGKDQSWNLVTPWYNEVGILAIISGPTTGAFSNIGTNLRVPVSWATNLQSNSRIDYGPTTTYGSTLSNASYITAHSFYLENLTNHSTYHYQVRSQTFGGQVVTSTDKEFYISFPPTVPTLIPESDIIGCSSGCTTTLAWNASSDSVDSGPIEYYAELSTTPTFVTVLANTGWIFSTTWADVPLPETNVTYYWRVKSRDANHTTAQDPPSAWSTVDSFIVSDGTAPQVTLASPAYGSSYGGYDGWYYMSFSWGSTPPGQEYQVQVSTDPDFTTINNSSGWIASSTWSVWLTHPLATTTTYYWRVQGKLNGVEGPWSPIWMFRVIDYGTSSCPFLFTWDGEKFVFEADLYGAGKLAAKTKTGYLKPEPNDYYVLKQRPVTKDGLHELRLVEERFEVDYLDEFKLYAIDAPKERRVFAEKPQAGATVPFTELGRVLHTVAIDAAVPLSIIHVNTGVDVTAKLAADDDDFVVLNEDKNVDFTYQTLELDLGSIQQAPQVKIVMDAMSMFPDTEEGIARSSAFGARTILEVQDQVGSWVKVAADKGALPKAPEFSRPYVFDITNIWLSDRRKVRFTFLFKTYVDWILVDTTADVPVTITEVPMVSATLGVRGIDPKTSDGDIYEYIYGEPTGQTAYLPGSYTRLGDVKPLLAGTDDKFVIYGGGDEIVFTFMPIGPPPPDNRRSYVVYTNGYYKDVKVDVPHTVEPLPFAAMSNFPYDEMVEHYPDDAEHAQYRQEYNTRFVAP